MILNKPIHEFADLGFRLRPNPAPHAELPHKVPIPKRLMAQSRRADLVRFKERLNVVEQCHARRLKV